MPILWVRAALFVASMVHPFAHSRGAFLIDSAIKLPAAAPLIMLAVIPVEPGGCSCQPSMPPAPCWTGRC